MNIYEQRIADLEKVLSDVLETFHNWNDGCSCCSTQIGCETSDYKKAEEVLHTDWRKDLK